MAELRLGFGAAVPNPESPPYTPRPPRVLNLRVTITNRVTKGGNEEPTPCSFAI